MKKQLFLLILVLFGLLCLNVFGASDKRYTFDYKKSGQGKRSIIFIPGFACSGDVWNETRKTFENDFTCYTLTMAGFAGVAPQPDASFKQWTNSVAEFIRDQKIDQPVIIGHSMGGGLAMAIAAEYPELVSRIVVVDALPCLSAMTNPEFKSKENPDCSETVAKMTSTPDDDFLKMQKQVIASMLADTSHQDEVVNWSMKSDRKTCALMYCDFSNTDLRETIKTVSCPALVLLESYFINYKPAIEGQYSNLKTARLKYADKGLHFIMFDDPMWFMNQLETFIR